MEALYVIQCGLTAVLLQQYGYFCTNKDLLFRKSNFRCFKMLIYSFIYNCKTLADCNLSLYLSNH